MKEHGDNIQRGEQWRGSQFSRGIGLYQKPIASICGSWHTVCGLIGAALEEDTYRVKCTRNSCDGVREL